MDALVVTLGSLLYLGAALVPGVSAQDQFLGQITCYECYDKAENTTCGQPVMSRDIDQLGVINCKRGACIKWTFHRNSELMMKRTCSEKISVHIPLNDVCQTERNGNGYLCMCATDFCNAAAHTGSGLVAAALLVPVGVILSWCTPGWTS